MTLFTNTDFRASLSWRGRFAAVTNAVNYYSVEEEVLANGDGTEANVGRTLAWYYQETHKGIKQSIPMFGDMGRNEADFKTNTVFYCYPSSMNSTNISLLVRAAHLTQGIPALARPTGGTSVFPVLNRNCNYNLNHVPTPEDEEDENATSFGLARPNGWPTRFRWNDRWLHSDMKDVSYFYNFKFYEKVIEKGNLR